MYSRGEDKMYINERGEVNYHSFIKALREYLEVPTGVACKGVCTISGWNRFENGNRLAEKLMFISEWLE